MMELSFERNSSQFIGIIVHLNLLLSYATNQTGGLLGNLTSFLEQSNAEVSPNLNIIRLYSLSIQVMDNNQIFNDL